MGVGGPYSGGQSHHRQPLFKICRMPLITRRSSTRSLPRTSFGKSGSIRHHCSSLSQNKLDRISLPPNQFGSENQQAILSATLLLGCHPSRSINCRSFRATLVTQHCEFKCACLIDAVSAKLPISRYAMRRTPRTRQQQPPGGSSDLCSCHTLP